MHSVYQAFPLCWRPGYEATLALALLLTSIDVSKIIHVALPLHTSVSNVCEVVQGVVWETEGDG